VVNFTFLENFRRENGALKYFAGGEIQETIKIKSPQIEGE